MERWTSGCHNARQVWRERAAQGYPGSYRTVVRLTGYLRRQERMGVRVAAPPTGMTPAQAAGLVVTRPEQRTASERRVLEQLDEVHPDIPAVLAHFASFAALVRQRSEACPASPLEQWTAQAVAGGVPEPERKAFATKLQQDWDSVVAALTLPYSQGQTEGQVNRLKLLKRSRYGRAKFELSTRYPFCESGV